MRILTIALLLTSALEGSAQNITVVKAAAGPGAWGAGTRIARDLRIGELEGSDEYTFGAIAGIAVGVDGTIFVADDQGPVLRMYDSRGKFVRVLGRKGGGPGEYEELQGIAALPDGRFAIWDPRNGRITVYDGKGEYNATHVVKSAYFGSNTFAVDRAGNYYVKGSQTSSGPTTDPALYWLKVDTKGQVADTLPIPLLESDPSFVLATPGGYMRPFTRMTTSAFSTQGYLVSGRNDRYAIDLLRPSGGVLRIERDYTPVSLSRAEAAQWEAWAEFFKQMVAGERARAAASNGRMRVPGGSTDSRIPSTKPPFRDLKVDDDGRIWVTRYVQAQEVPQPPRKEGDKRPILTWREPETFDVFEPSGRFLGQVALPMRTWLLAARGNLIYALTLGEQDEQYVVRYRIEPAK